MTPIDFPGANTTFAKNQPEYLPLPAMREEDGTVTTCWQLTEEEIIDLVRTRKLYISIMTFNEPLQPIRPWVEKAEPAPIAPHDECNTPVPSRQFTKPENMNSKEVEEAYECWEEVKRALNQEDKEHLIRSMWDVIKAEGVEAAWPYFKFEQKMPITVVNLIHKAFEYVQYYQTFGPRDFNPMSDAIHVEKF